jgi:hypothetical protein
VQRQEFGAMPATLAYEQQQPVVPSGDEAMGADKPLRCVYDHRRHSNLRLEPTPLAKFVIGSTAGAIGVPLIHRVAKWVSTAQRGS